jgi:uncharacterized protein YkwD
MRRTTAVTSALGMILILCVTVLAGLAAPAGASASTSLSVLEREVLAGVNAQRTARGLAPVRPQADLMCAARAHSRSMAHQAYFSHYSLGGAPFGLRLLGHGYERDGFASWSVGENIGSARASTVAATPQRIVLLWMQSAAHRQVILSGAFRDAGIGIHRAGGRRYFTLDLGYRRR